MADASSQELSKLQQTVKDFKDRYALLSSNSYGAQIARTGDNALMLEYGQTLAKARLINSAIDTFAEKYQGAKDYFGLGAFPLIPIIAVAALSATVLGGVALVDRFLRKAGVAQIQADNPGMNYETAAQRYEAIHRSTFEKTIDAAQMAMIIGIAIFAYFIVSR